MKAKIGARAPIWAIVGAGAPIEATPLDPQWKPKSEQEHWLKLNLEQGPKLKPPCWILNQSVNRSKSPNNATVGAMAPIEATPLDPQWKPRLEQEPLLKPNSEQEPMINSQWKQKNGARAQIKAIVGGEKAILFCMQFVLHADMLFLQHSAVLYPAEHFCENDRHFPFNN